MHTQLEEERKKGKPLPTNHVAHTGNYYQLAGMQ